MPLLGVRQFLVAAVDDDASPILPVRCRVDLYAHTRIGAHPVYLLPGHRKAVEPVGGQSILDGNDIGLAISGTAQAGDMVLSDEVETFLSRHFSDQHEALLF
ncbi:hypothetical protein D9M70_442200 [compost metagenome]